MKKLFQVVAFAALIHVTLDVHGQIIPVEAMLGHKNYYYQHSFSRPITGTKLGFFHTSSFYHFNREKTNEIMSQAYVTYALNPSFKLAVGSFYASAPGFRMSAAIQVVKKMRDVTFVFVPRFDLKKNASAEIMTFVEYRPLIKKSVRLYTRAQAMSNYGPENHNRSYQNFRIGIDFNKTQFGLALNVDEYGKEIQTARNFGIFIRHELQ